MKGSFALPVFVLAIASHGAMALTQSAGTFAATGNMITPRFGHIATLLPNGNVLIAGGYTVCSIGAPCVGTNSAELYNPITGAFTATDSMTTIYPRGGVLLPDGRVLFAEGNFNFIGKVATVEFYDPITGNFNVAGSRSTLTAVNSATLLNDGRVLLVGWIGTIPAIPSAELYDPAAETFSPVAHWPHGYPAPPVTVLLDGRVLLEYSDDYAELYDPTAGTFSVTDGLAFFGDPPPASLLMNGKVLFTGGNDYGGNESGAELFDPAAGTFAATGKMSAARDGHTSTLLPDGTVLAAGGLQYASNRFPAIATAELYDPATGGFFAAANMTTPRALHTAVLLNSGQVLITGGSAFGVLNSFSAMSSAELYTPVVPVPALVLFSLSGDGRGQGAIWHAETGQIASAANPAIAGEALSMYTTSLVDGGVIPPQVAIGGRLAEILYFGAAPGYSGYFQVNFRIPNGVVPGPAVPVRLTYIDRPSNEVSIGVRSSS
jgi:hypothetical protein